MDISEINRMQWREWSGVNSDRIIKNIEDLKSTIEKINFFETLSSSNDSSKIVLGIKTFPEMKEAIFEYYDKSIRVIEDYVE